MKMIKNLAAMVILCLGLASQCIPAFAQDENFYVGDLIDSGSYCLGEDLDFIRGFTAYMERDGMAAYNAVMLSPDSRCYDTRIHENANMATAKLVEKLWDFQIANSIKLTLWKVQDASGAFGYMWTMPNDDGD